MRTSLFLSAICVSLVIVHSAPAPEPNPSPDANPNPASRAANLAAIDDNTPEIIEIIAPAASAQETLSTLNLGSPSAEVSERNKRTIGILRELFPQLTKAIEGIVQQITGFILQTFGPILLRSFIGNRNGPKNAGGDVIILDDDEEDDDITTTESSRRKRALYYWPNVAADENQLLAGSESQQAEVRVAFGENQGDLQVAASEDQQTAAANTNSASIDEITLDDTDISEENRNKRFLSFGGQASAGAGGGGSGGGSGNFLFDIIRLVAGSSSGSSNVEGNANASGDVEADDAAGAAKGDNLTEGVPGPITRLFIIANRGIANLIQDLILRLAQTSERIVNFKARLITSII